MSTDGEHPLMGAPSRRTRVATVIAIASLGIAALTLAAIFLEMMYPFGMPVFLAAVIAMLAQPAYDRLTRRLGGSRGIAAGLVLTGIVAVVLVPMILAAEVAAREWPKARQQIRQLTAPDDRDPATHPGALEQLVDGMHDYLPLDMKTVHTQAMRAADLVGHAIASRSTRFAGDFLSFLLRLIVLVCGIFFFLVDGPNIVAALEDLSPLDPRHERLIREEIVRVTKGVVWATLIAAGVQGVLMGVGMALVEWFFHAGIGGWIVLLAMLTMIVSTIPFLGAPAVWIPVCLDLLLHDNIAAAIALAAFGLVVILPTEHVLKIVIIKDSVRLHPLLAILCVFGGLHLFGFLGIFIGPIVGAILLACLRILRQTLRELDSPIAQTE